MMCKHVKEQTGIAIVNFSMNTPNQSLSKDTIIKGRKVH